jgi:hypothetical protein
VGLPQSSSENSAKRATISKALPYYAFGVAENSYGWSMRLSQAATRETVLERAREIAVGNNSSQAG